MNREENIDKMIEKELNAFKESLINMERNKEDKKDAVDVESSNESADNELNDEPKDIQLAKEAELDIEWVDAEEDKPAKTFKKRLMDSVVRCAVMLIALCAFGYAAYELTLIYVESAEGEALKSDTSDLFLVDPSDLVDKYEPPTGEDGGSISFENLGDGKLFVYDHKKMLGYNSDAKGYIRQDNGEYIDNPILQTNNNEYYLTHLANHRKSSIGAIYIDSLVDEGLNAKNCIIHGHNIGDRAGRIMFGSLNWYYNKSNYYKEHPTFDIWIEDTHYRYYVFAIHKINVSDNWVYRYRFDSDEQFMDYIARCIKASKYKFTEAPEITVDSNIITLSTCTHTEEMRMIVQLVRGEELDVYGNPVVYEDNVETSDAQEVTE